MSPLYTRNDLRSDDDDRCITNRLLRSPSKHLRRPPPPPPITTTGRMGGGDDDDNDNDTELNHSNWYELNDEEENDDDDDNNVNDSSSMNIIMNDVVPTSRHGTTTGSTKMRYKVPTNTPMVFHQNHTERQLLLVPGNNTTTTTTGSTTSRLLFHELDSKEFPITTTTSLTERLLRLRNANNTGSTTTTNNSTPNRRSSNQELNDTSCSSYGSVMSTTTSSSPSSSSSYIVIHNNSPHHNHTEPSHSLVGGGRKRNSLERRQPTTNAVLSMTTGTTTTPTPLTPVPLGRKYHPRPENTTLGIEPSQHGGAALTTTTAYGYTSPKMSPNSYRTLDGRFVQSKNPFSSPMMMTKTTTTTTPTIIAMTNDPHNNTLSLLPQLPNVHVQEPDTLVCSSNTGSNIVPSLPPHSPNRHVLQPKLSFQCTGTPVTQATVGLQAFSFHTNNNNNHHHTHNYICSPIPESPQDHKQVVEKSLQLQIPPPQPQQAYPMMMMTETDDVPTAGSLHKVRRIHRTDDVFAASNHHLSNLRQDIIINEQQQQQHKQPPLAIDTTTSTSTDMMMMMMKDNTDIDDISPTDVVTAFPQQAFFAPTPVVPKHGPPPTPMKQPRSSNLLLFSSSNAAVSSKTRQQPQPQYTPYPHGTNGLSRRDSSSPPTPDPPTVTRKLLPRTPLVSLLSSENRHPLPDQQRQQQSQFWQSASSKDYDHPNDDEWMMYESDNSCGYMTNDVNHYYNTLYSRQNNRRRPITDDNNSICGGGDASGPIPTSRFYSDFDIIGELGNGSFGSVYKVLSRLDGCMYAIKAAKRQAKGIADRDRMLKEVYALAALSDQADTANFHIVRYHQAWMEDDRLYIQTELCSGTLTDEMNRTQPPTLQNVSRRYKLLREILLALDFIHRHNMVHLDIKPENIFIKNDQYKLGDFGLVTKASSSQDVEEGDSRYMSMELLSGDNRSDLTKSDIFSLGITMYEICLGRQLPMNGEEWQDIRAGKLMPLPNTDHDMANIIKRMLDPNPMNRPTPASLLKHPQLLSDEEKALNAERTKVIHANIQLAAQQQMHMGLTLPKRALTRANTWSGTSLPYP